MNDWALVLSGSSFELSDAIKLEKSKLNLCAVNGSWMGFSFHRLQLLYAMDLAFWQAYHHQIETAAQRWTSNHSAAQLYHLNLDHRQPQPFEVNSGLRAAMFILHRFRPSQLWIFGIGGSGHWHDDHDQKRFKSLSNPSDDKVKHWSQCWKELNHYCHQHAIKTQLINGCQPSSFTIFPYQSLP